jgi:phage terminase large subunit-like protein
VDPGAVPWFAVPAEGARRRAERDGVNYPLWIDQQHIVGTSGAVVDYAAVEAYIAELAENYRVEAIAIDRWNSTSTTTRLMEQGLPVVRFGKGFASMSPACKELERLVLARQLYHTGCPVLRWCLGNVCIESDAASNIKITKAKSKDRVDGAVALAMAVGVASASSAGSVYAESLSFLTI